MHHQWLLLAACFWVIFMFMVASKFITLTFKDPDVYGARQEFLLLTTMPEVRKLPEEKHIPEELKTESCSDAHTGVQWCDLRLAVTSTSQVQPTGKELPDSRLVQPLVYMERLELIRNVCRDDALKNLSHTPVSKFVLDRIFVCDKHRILFCQTPKVGNTQWKKVLIVLNGAFPSIEEIPENVVHDHEKNGLPRLSSFSDAEIQKRLKTYFKFFIVRDPFERLISAFKDKFVHNPRFEPWYRHEIAPGIIRKYRRNRTETRGIQFEDFVRYLGDPNHRWLDLQFGDHIIHWVTYVELCAPCEIMYSVIGHHETLEDDAPYILKEAGIDHLVSYPTIPPGITVYNRTKVEHYFLGISKRDIRRLYARFEGDFKLFGYQKPDFLLN
ncbi:carbohydrate sulfotransferase 10 isoform X1 [Papio anubis]|uniref:carbohydrate sulfotransferase 10 isoform X1 n=1 Tax=Papio anubis TaxID=9555 RepID=UPI0012AE4B39|nr:carbohydrate sulfotransferase 10 isoform X1 [Papio anubis]XP_021780803.2 carbohydrate sulfotransferase 10 isoform X1 [Papio anubis]XP_021780804.2 carbohydrate sulfotransferase 10 isoform X1 [Papio anubis]XP_021780805.2 carbohydrate sulfotransferase 10 isoform X1 [Papio anubis]XP_021780806.2 carbohydrate sulfotransferase 10 isoform X1 [Papio anubis]XP_021780807.2 carbohydrate sulfotransferase 10 isoform X1 [Papio anubis]